MPTANLTDLEPLELQDRLRQIREEEREIRAEMEPYELRLAAVRADSLAIQAELRRRERADRHQARSWVKANLKGREFPSLEEVLATSAILGDEGFSQRRFFLATGGEVSLGFAAASRQSVTLTDGTRNESAATFGEAAALYAQGLELGTSIKPGVRVHFTGTRQEKLVAGDEVFVGPAL